MRQRYWIGSIFLVWLLVLGLFFQASVHTMIETRRSTLVAALIDRGDNALSAVTVLSTLDTVGSLDSVNLDEELSLIMSEEKVTIGNETIWNWPWGLVTGSNVSYYNELYTPYLVTSVLKRCGAIDRANRTALIKLVMERYNETQGAFHELARTYPFDEREYADCFFPLNEDASHAAASHGGYASANVISTFLAVSVLDNLQALDQINTTKTLQWILDCKAQNGVFRPSPDSSDSSYYQDKGFWVDFMFGTGMAYTYAALSTLMILNANISNVVDVGKIREYVAACNETLWNGGIEFGSYYDQFRWNPDFYSTYYAVMILHEIGVLENETDLVSGVITYVRLAQDLHFTDEGFMPTRNNAGYGLFCYSIDPYTEDLFAVTILNETNNIHLLDEVTPIVLPAWRNLVFMTSVLSLATLVFLGLGFSAYNRVRAWKNKEKRLHCVSNDGVLLHSTGLESWATMDSCVKRWGLLYLEPVG